MGVIKFILHVLGWLVTIIIQIALSFLIIFLLSVIFAGLDTTARSGWLAVIFAIWLGYGMGINLVGYVALRWLWKTTPLLTAQRLLGTAIGALIPLLILLGIGFSLPIGDAGSPFYDLVTNHWQPILAQTSLFIAIIGYYLPGAFKAKTPIVKEG